MSRERIAELEVEVHGLRLAAKSALMVLCVARAGQTWHENMLKDFDFAIAAIRDALFATESNTK